MKLFVEYNTRVHSNLIKCKVLVVEVEKEVQVVVVEEVIRLTRAYPVI